MTAASDFDQGTTPRRQLSYSACKQIERFVLVPILKEAKLKPFHPLVRTIPSRIVNKQIVCLRDLEKILLWLAPVSPLVSSYFLRLPAFVLQLPSFSNFLLSQLFSSPNFSPLATFLPRQSSSSPKLFPHHISFPNFSSPSRPISTLWTSALPPLVSPPTFYVSFSPSYLRRSG